MTAAIDPVAVAPVSPTLAREPLFVQPAIVQMIYRSAIGTRATCALIILSAICGCKQNRAAGLTAAATAKVCYDKYSRLDGKADAKRAFATGQVRMYRQSSCCDTEFDYIVGSNCQLPPNYDQTFFVPADVEPTPGNPSDQGPYRACWSAWERYYAQFNGEIARLDPKLVRVKLKGSFMCPEAAK